MSEREIKFDELRYQKEIERRIGKRDKSAYQIYRANGPFAHVAEVYSEATAQLFVAAPTLYAACKMLKEGLDDRYAAWIGSKTAWMGEYLEALNAALEAANGGK